MKNYFKEGQCNGSEKDCIANLQWCIDSRISVPDHETVGWLFNYIKYVESQKDGGNGGGSDLKKRLDDIDLKIADFVKFISELSPKIDSTLGAFQKDVETLATEVQKHNAGMLYLKKELDALKSKQPSDTPKPAPAPAPGPEPKPTEPKPEPKPQPSDPPKTFAKK